MTPHNVRFQLCCAFCLQPLRQVQVVDEKLVEAHCGNVKDGADQELIHVIQQAVDGQHSRFITRYPQPNTIEYKNNQSNAADYEEDGCRDGQPQDRDEHEIAR